MEDKDKLKNNAIDNNKKKRKRGQTKKELIMERSYRKNSKEGQSKNQATESNSRMKKEATSED